MGICAGERGDAGGVSAGAAAAVGIYKQDKSGKDDAGGVKKPLATKLLFHR